MKVQYFGDVSDYRKFAPLGVAAEGGFRTGLCSMLTEGDGPAMVGGAATSTGRRKGLSIRNYSTRWRAVPAIPTLGDLRRVEQGGADPTRRLYFETPVSDRPRGHEEPFTGSAMVALSGATTSSSSIPTMGSNSYLALTGAEELEQVRIP